MIDVRALPSVAFEHRHTLPDLMAIYIVVDGSGNVLYVGSTESLRTRWKSHHRRFQIKHVNQARVHWFEINDPLSLRKTEAEWINQLSPSLNRQPVTGAPTVMIATLVSFATKQTLEYLAKREDRSVSKIVKQLVEESPRFQAALREVVTAA
jgi:excinuclease UvrABC nuclease subunit